MLRQYDSERESCESSSTLRRASNPLPLALLLSLLLPLRVRVTILVLVSFYASQSKEYAKRKLKLWLGCLHPHVIFTSYDNLSSLNMLKYLDHSFYKKKKMKCFLQGDRFRLKFISYFRENLTKIRLKKCFCACKCIYDKSLKTFFKSKGYAKHISLN